MKCPRCDGKGTQALHGAAITVDEFYGPDWDQDMRDDYRDGVYDTACDGCGGSGKVDRDEYDDRVQAEHEMRMGY